MTVLPDQTEPAYCDYDFYINESESIILVGKHDITTNWNVECNKKVEFPNAHMYKHGQMSVKARYISDSEEIEVIEGYGKQVTKDEKDSNEKDSNKKENKEESEEEDELGKIIN